MSPTTFNIVQFILSGETRPSIRFGDLHLTYEDLLELTSWWSARLANEGVGQGDRIALMLFDTPDFIGAFLGVASLGGISVPLNTYLPKEDVAFILNDCGPTVLIADEEFEEIIEVARRIGIQVVVINSNAGGSIKERRSASALELAQTTSESPVLLLYTSGSTGKPKGVLHKHGAIEHTVSSYARQVLGLSSNDIVFSASKLFFAYGFGNSLSFPMSAGAEVILQSERSNAASVAKVLTLHRPTVLFGVPAVFRSLLDSYGTNLDVSSLRLCISAGEALPGQLFEEWKKAYGLTLLDGIGSTEMLHIFISNREGMVRAGTSGSIVDGYQARLTSDLNDEVSPGENGDLWIMGKSSFIEYWNRTDLTEETIKEGWVKTGDVYTKDHDGFFSHVGRSDDCFKVKGLWVSPIEVEGALASHESVSEVAVVNGKTAGGLATVRAYVVIRGDGTDLLKDELRAHVAKRLPAHKVPSQVDFIREMPRTSTGKIQRFKLRKLASGA